MEMLIYGFINSAILALMAMGFTLVYGVSRLANFAHGALYVFTGFVSWFFFVKIGLSYPLSIAIALFATALVGAAIYHIFMVRVRGMEASEVIGFIAIGLVIIEFLRWSGFVGHGFALPAFARMMIFVGGVPVDLQRVIIVGSMLLIGAFLWLFTHYTRAGLAFSAVAQDEQAAMMLGMDSDRIAMLSLTLGSGLAGVAAVLIIPLGNLNIEAGYSVLIYAVAVCIVGGLGSWPGAIIASFIIGFGQMLTERFIASQYQSVFAMAAIVITLLLKPSGIFGKQKELEERV